MHLKPSVLALLALFTACGGAADDATRSDSAGPHASAADSAPAGLRAASGASGASGCAPAAITGEGIGAVRLGMKADSLRAACAGVSERREPGDEGSTALVFDVPLGADTAVAEVDVGQVWRIQVRQPGLRTANGVGVGSPVRELLADEGARGISGEGRLFVTTPAHCGLSFQLAPEAARALPAGGDAPALRKLPNDTRIIRILVVGCRKRAA